MLSKRITSIPRFVRRWKNLFACAGVLCLATGGAAYYWFGDTAAAKQAAAEREHEAHSATDELKSMFAEQAIAEHEQLAAADVEQWQNESKAEPTESTASATPVGDRYASWSLPADTAPNPGEALDELTETVGTPLAEEKVEIARGQDPGDNPLRNRRRAAGQAIQPAAAHQELNEEDARQAFAEAAPLGRYPAEGGFPTGTPDTAAPAQQTATQVPQQAAGAHAAAASNPFASAPGGAAPMPTANAPASDPVAQEQSYSNPTGYPAPQQTPQNAPTPATSSQIPSRYGAVEPTPAAMSAATTPPPQLPPVVDLGAQTASAIPQEPTPAFPLESSSANAPLRTAAIGMTQTPGIGTSLGEGRPGERLLEGTQSPSLSIQKLAPAEIQVGKRCVFAIRIQNTGQRTAQNVQIHDQIPAGTELIGTAPKASVSGGEVVWDLGTLSVGEERTVEMELVPTEEGELGSVATVTLEAQASAKARCTKPELALRLTSSPEVHVGDQQLVQIEIANPGTGVATGVMLMENVPAGVSHEAGPALEFEVGTLAPGESRRLDLVLTAEQAGRIANSMNARSDSGLNVEASCEFEVVAPELRVAVDGPDRRFLERPATYQVSIENPGTAAAKEVQLVTHLPKGMQFVSANNLGEYDAAAHSVYWSLAELPANERGTVELVALPVEPGQHTLQVSTKARDGLTDQTQKQVSVEGIAALMFEVVDREDPIEVGGETEYEIRVVNQGSKAAMNVQVIALLPPGLRAISGHGDTRHTVQGDRVVFEPLTQLGPKAESNFRIQVQGIRAGDQRLRVQITTDEIREPITKEESTRVYSDQ